MRSHKLFPVLAVLSFALVAGPALADGHWTVSLGAGQSVSKLHGSAIEGAAYAQLYPLLGLGLEGGMAYMNFDTVPVVSFPVEPEGGIGSMRLASLTDGLTRNRGLFVGPALRFGQQLYAVASAGIYEFTDNNGNWLARRYGGSAGIGLTGKRRFSPRAEVRYRWAPDRTAPPETLPAERLMAPFIHEDASAIVFTIGVDLH